GRRATPSPARSCAPSGTPTAGPVTWTWGGSGVIRTLPHITPRQLHLTKVGAQHAAPLLRICYPRREQKKTPRLNVAAPRSTNNMIGRGRSNAAVDAEHRASRPAPT